MKTHAFLLTALTAIVLVTGAQTLQEPSFQTFSVKKAADSQLFFVLPATFQGFHTAARPIGGSPNEPPRKASLTFTRQDLQKPCLFQPSFAIRYQPWYDKGLQLGEKVVRNILSKLTFLK